jgi:predicted transcriptional regulator YdeE
METEKLEKFYVIGISVRTTNENGKAGIDIPELWNKFMSENLIEKIPNKIDNTIYCIYTEYEKDYTKPYTTILGCKVSSIENIPNEMVAKTFENENYRKFVAKGNILQGMVFGEWTKIWNTEIDRKYSADFEVYGEKAQNPENAEVDIYVSLN